MPIGKQDMVKLWRRTDLFIIILIINIDMIYMKGICWKGPILETYVLLSLKTVARSEDTVVIRYVSTIAQLAHLPLNFHTTSLFQTGPS